MAHGRQHTADRCVLQDTIWFKRNWISTLKSTFDGLVYGLLTAGMFGWLWPR